MAWDGAALMINTWRDQIDSRHSRVLHRWQNLVKNSKIEINSEWDRWAHNLNLI
jgi:hypothetical protein